MEHSPNNEILPIINHEITAHSHLIPIPSVHWKGIRENALFFLFHQAVGALMILGLSLQKDIGFITDRLYPANTAQQKNPFWKINSRPEAEDDSRGYSETLRYIQTINEVMDISTQTIIQFPKGILHL